MPARLTVDVFTPLPPLRTDIANMSRAVLRELAGMAELRAWTPQAEWAPALDGEFEVRRFDPDRPPVRELNRADLTIYNLGNNAQFHRGIFDVARRGRPGLVVLHDTRLQHFFAAYSETEGEPRQYYRDAMRRAHGPEAEADARAFIAGEVPIEALVDRWPMTPAAVAPALGAILHNEAEYDALAAQVDLPLYLLPLPAAFTIAPAPPPRPARAADAPIRLAMFGFIGGNRCLPEVLRALAALPASQPARLDIYGALEQPEAADALIGELGLGDRVTRHGFVAEAVLTAALAETDLVFNLRNPTMGEASGSQLRIWAAALPSIVSDVGWYATLPEGTAFPVSPGDETGAILQHLARFRRDPAPYRLAGQRGRAELEQRHQPRQYAEALIRIAADAPMQHARRHADHLSDRSSRVLAGMLGATGASRFVQPVARGIRDVVSPPPSRSRASGPDR